MKNKKILYVLLPIVLVIWGVVIFKIVNALESPVAAPFSVTDPLLVKRNDFRKDSFQIVADYPDPFLKHIPRSKKKSLPLSVKKEKIYAPHSSEINWPDIKYTGMIRNQTKQEKIAIVEIDGREVLVKKNQIIDGLKLVKIYNDSITIVLRGHHKSYFR